MSCLVTRSGASKPTIRKRGNWIDFSADLYNSQRHVHGVMSE